MENTVAKKYYRFGVLEGNHVEERFGLDHAARLQDAKMSTISEARDKYSLGSSMYGVLQKEKEKASTQPANNTTWASTTLTQTYHITPGKETLLQTTPAVKEETDKQDSLKFTHNGEKAHLLFGHGLQEDDYKRRELLSTYNLSYANKVKPVDYIFSKFDSTQVPPVINPEDKVYIKNHMKGITAIGDSAHLNEKKTYRPYNNFTKSFDAVQSKIAFRK